MHRGRGYVHCGAHRRTGVGHAPLSPVNPTHVTAPHVWGAVSVLTILLGLLYVPVLRGLVAVWVADHNYSHGFFVPLIAGFLVWQKQEVLRAVTMQQSAWGGLLLLLGLCTLVGGQALLMVGGAHGALFLQGISLILVLVGLVLLLAGRGVFRTLAFPLGYLVLMFPLPEGIMMLVILPLQSYATQVTSAALHFLAIPALREGNLIMLPAMTLGVTEACSGIRSLLTLVTGAVALSYVTLPQWWQRLVLVGSVVPITLVTNAIRVTGTGLLAHFVGRAAAEGFLHGFAGWVLLLVAAGCLYAEVLCLSGFPGDKQQRDGAA
jgi:exosortase